ncbi:MAG: alpha/beta hydrolase [Minisyncoccia bacterium]
MKRILKIVLGVLLLFIILIVGWYLYNTRIAESLDPMKDAPLGTRFEKIDGENIAYSEIDNNASTTIIFIGGLLAWHGTWQRTLEVLSKDVEYNYIAIDLPPFGYSTVKEDGNFFRNTQAKRIEKFIEFKKEEEKSLEHVILVAHSYGAGPAAEAVLQDDKNVISKFIVIDGVLNIDEKKISTGKGLIQFDSLRNIAAGLGIHIDLVVANRLKSFVYVTQYIDSEMVRIYTNPLSVKGTTQKLSSWVKDYVNDPQNYVSNESKNYTSLDIPVRIIWGEEDVLTPIALTQILLSSVPDSKLYTLKEVGHIPMIEDYEQFDVALRKALDE